MKPPLPLPTDAPLLSVQDVAAYLRLSVAAIRKLLDGRPDADDGELGQFLRSVTVRLSAHRRYVRRAPFMAWLARHTGATAEDAA